MTVSRNQRTNIRVESMFTDARMRRVGTWLIHTVHRRVYRGKQRGI